MSGREMWRPIAGYEGLYEISNRGRVKSLCRTVIPRRAGGRPIYFVPERILKCGGGPEGHRTVRLYDLKKESSHRALGRQMLVHRLVGIAFLKNKAALPLVAHNDGNPSNNNVENLRWTTHAGNQQDRVKHGTSSRGSLNGNAKLTEKKVVAIRRDKRPTKIIATKYGVSPCTIRQVKDRRMWWYVP